MIGDFGATGLWTRINALNSPWALDDLVEIVAEVGDKLDVVMLPKVDGAWDIHYLDQLLAQLEAKHAINKPILMTEAILRSVPSLLPLGQETHSIPVGRRWSRSSGKVRSRSACVRRIALMRTSQGGPRPGRAAPSRR